MAREGLALGADEAGFHAVAEARIGTPERVDHLFLMAIDWIVPDETCSSSSRSSLKPSSSIPGPEASITALCKFIGSGETVVTGTYSLAGS